MLSNLKPAPLAPLSMPADLRFIPVGDATELPFELGWKLWETARHGQAHDIVINEECGPITSRLTPYRRAKVVAESNPGLNTWRDLVRDYKVMTESDSVNLRADYLRLHTTHGHVASPTQAKVQEDQLIARTIHSVRLFV